MIGKLFRFYASIFRSRYFLPLLYFIGCGALFLLLCSGLYGRYLNGTQLDESGFPSLYLVIILALLAASLLITAFLALCLFIQILRKNLSKFQLLSLLMLPACVTLPYYLNIPGFMDGVTDRFRSTDMSEDWVLFASTQLKNSQSTSSSNVDDYENAKKVISSHPLNKLGLKSEPRIIKQESSLVFLFGGPISQRWGLAISGDKGKEPTLPADSFDKRTISTEVVVFDIPNY